MAVPSTSLPFFLDGPVDDAEACKEGPDELAIAQATPVVESSLRYFKAPQADSPPAEDREKLKAQQKRIKMVKVKAVPPSERKSERLAADKDPQSPMPRRASMRFASAATTAFATTPSQSRPRILDTGGEFPGTPKRVSVAGGGEGERELSITPPNIGFVESAEPVVKVILKATPLFVQRCLSGGIGSPRQRAWSRSSGSPSQSPRTDSSHNLRSKKAYAYEKIDPEMEVNRYAAAYPAGDDGGCGCDYALITVNSRGFDYSRYHAHALFRSCAKCSRQPSAYLCLHCLESFCPSHVEAHTNRSEESKAKCTLYINILDISTSFDRIFWCERCRRFTWKFTDEYEPFTDRIAVTKGTYLDEPVTDVWMKQYVTHLSRSHRESLLSTSGDSVSVERSAPKVTLSLSLSASRRRSGTEHCMSETNRPASPPHLNATVSGVETQTGSEAFQFLVEQWNTASSPTLGATTIKALGCSMQGWRSGQEDAEAAFTIEARPTTPGALDCSCAVFCVFDGHGGDAVAKLVARDIKRHLEREFKDAPPLTNEALTMRVQDAEGDVFNGNSGDASAMVEHFTSIFTNAFLKLDREIQESEEGQRGDFNCVGCTACVTAITEDFIICANVGDSGAVLFHPAGAKKRRMSLFESNPTSSNGSPTVSAHVSAHGSSTAPPAASELAATLNGTWAGGLSTFAATLPETKSPSNDAIAIVPLSEAHRLSNDKEACRVKSAGYSILDERIEGMLSVPRAFGDYDFKQCGAKPPEEQAVTALPDVVVLPRKRRGRQTEFASEVLEERDWTIVIACDGIWDTLPTDAVCKLMHRHLYPVATSARNIEQSPENLSLGADPMLSSKSFGNAPPNSSPPSGLDQGCINAINAVFDHCIAPQINDQGLGMDNMSILILRPAVDADLEDDAASEVSL